MELHKILSPCRPENLVRRPLHFRSLPPFFVQTDKFIYACTACSFETMNGRLMADHLVSCKDGKARLKERLASNETKKEKSEAKGPSKRFVSKNAKILAKHENLETVLFGLKRMSNIKVNIVPFF